MSPGSWELPDRVWPCILGGPARFQISPYYCLFKVKIIPGPLQLCLNQDIMKSILALAILILAAIAIHDCEAAAVGEIEPAAVRQFPPRAGSEAISEGDNEVDPKVSQYRKEVVPSGQKGEAKICTK